MILSNRYEWSGLYGALGLSEGNKTDSRTCAPRLLHPRTTKHKRGYFVIFDLMHYGSFRFLFFPYSAKISPSSYCFVTVDSREKTSKKRSPNRIRRPNRHAMHNSVFDGKPAGRSHSVHSAFCCYYSPSFFFDDDGRGNEVWLNRMLNHLSSQHFTPLVTQLARTLPRTTKLILHKHKKKRAWAQNLNLLLNSRVTNRSFIFMEVSQLLTYSAKYCAKLVLFYTLKLSFLKFKKRSTPCVVSVVPLSNWKLSRLASKLWEFDSNQLQSSELHSHCLSSFLPLWKMNEKSLWILSFFHSFQHFSLSRLTVSPGGGNFLKLSWSLLFLRSTNFICLVKKYQRP